MARGRYRLAGACAGFRRHRGQFAGNVDGLFKAIEMVEVPITMLTYFVYPLVTGLAVAATGVERMSLRGAVAALVAFLGLALMIGAHPSGAHSPASDSPRRRGGARGDPADDAHPSRRRDMRLITRYSIITATAVFVALAIATADWQPPATRPDGRRWSARAWR